MLVSTTRMGLCGITLKSMNDVFNAMDEVLQLGGNPSSIHRLGQRALALYEQALASIRSSLGAFSAECCFTGSAYEAHALALKNHVLHAQPSQAQCLVLGTYTLPQAYVLLSGVSAFQTVASYEALRALLGPTTACVWLGQNHGLSYAQIGVLSNTVRQWGVPLHVHGVLGGGFEGSGVQSMVLDAFEMGGPPGLGLLVAQKGLLTQPLWWGGEQQKGLRPGTLPVALAVGFAMVLTRAIPSVKSP
jgi:cysteine desulfurase